MKSGVYQSTRRLQNAELFVGSTDKLLSKTNEYFSVFFGKTKVKDNLCVIAEFNMSNWAMSYHDLFLIFQTNIRQLYF